VVTLAVAPGRPAPRDGAESAPMRSPAGEVP